MLSHEQAVKELETLRDKDWVKKRLTKVEKLPARLRESARTLLGKEEKKSYPGLYDDRYSSLFRELLDCSEKDVEKVVRTLFPEMGDEVMAAYWLRDSGAYQTSYVRRPFRTSHPGLRKFARNEWLTRFVSVFGQYPHDPKFIATWGGYLNGGSTSGTFLAAIINAGGERGSEVRQILMESASGEHEKGMMGRHVVEGMLQCNDPSCWEFIEKMLLAAQRSEGLRQTILERVDEGHPEAFVRMLRLILDENLVRFPAVVRAADVWFGMMWDSASAGVIKKDLERVLSYFEDEKARKKGLKGTAQDLYFALWVAAFRDEQGAMKEAETFFKDKDVERRYAALLLVSQLQHGGAYQLMTRLVDDPDLRVADLAICSLLSVSGGSSYHPFHHREDEPGLIAELNAFDKKGLFERVEGMLAKYPKNSKQQAIVFPWRVHTLKVQEPALLMANVIEDRPLTRLLPYIDLFESYSRGRVIGKLASQKKWDTQTRDAMFRLVGNSSSYARDAALKGLEKCTMTADEAEKLEEMLSRKSADLRRGVMGILLKQSDKVLMSSMSRLIGAKSQEMRQSGLELMRQSVEQNRLVESCREETRKFVEQYSPLGDDDQQQVDVILALKREVPTLADGLGLFDPGKRTPIVPPEFNNVEYITEAAVNLLESLMKVMDEQAKTIVEVTGYNGVTQEVFSNLKDWQITWVDRGDGGDLPTGGVSAEAKRLRIHLESVWRGWYETLPAKCRDQDGLQLMRALACCQYRAPMLSKIEKERAKGNRKKVLGLIDRLQKISEFDRLETILEWLGQSYVQEGAVDYSLDVMENTLAVLRKIIDEALKTSAWSKKHKKSPQNGTPILTWEEAEPVRAFALGYGEFKETLSDEQACRLFRLFRWQERPGYLCRSKAVAAKLILLAFRLHEINEHDLFYYLLTTPPALPEECLNPNERSWYRHHAEYALLRAIFNGQVEQELKADPRLPGLIERAKGRVVDVELTRGQAPTAATPVATIIKKVGHMELFLRVASLLSAEKLQRGYAWGADSESKGYVFSHFIKQTSPLPEETPEVFAKRIAGLDSKAGLKVEKLIDIAFFAPQWAGHIEEAIGWPGFEEAVWWMRAHTKDDSWGYDNALKETWDNEIKKRTPLSMEDLADGGVDVAWFNEVHAKLSGERWSQLFDSAKYASSGVGHKRAELFAQAMLGQQQAEDLSERVTKKRYQDAVRALGLVPLAKKGKVREAEILSRYQTIQEFLRTSKQFGSQRQASEKKAGRIGLENLARTAGYPDPIRLEWAMELEEFKDLKDGTMTVTAGEVSVTLTVDDQGESEITVMKAGKLLKSIPPALKKNEQILAVTERKTTLKRQAARIRKSLEEMMCRGEQFTGEELMQLFGHPILRPLLSRVVLIGEGIMGYPVEGGRALSGADGKLEPVKKTEKFRIAHAVDLLEGGAWTEWQRDCFKRENVQPFKQLFRELYVVSAAENKKESFSKRYAGHQVNPRQALSLLGTRGWVTSGSEGGAFKVHHQERIITWLEFQEGFFTPAEIDGLTLENVRFAKRDGNQPLQLGEVPPKVFSEVMRDLDLVVSVAHRGGVDPEASQSTIEMRSSLLAETCELMGLKNVEIRQNHAFISGKFGDYNVHLGSANAFKMPGKMLYIVAVHAQHWGRLFLPFADSDPKTAEVLSKVILLAEDKKIQDPSILEQVR
ncbi:DUF4132 domain-containing protein [Lacunimicrobium album]